MSSELSKEELRQRAIELLKSAHPTDLVEILKESLLEQNHLPTYPDFTDLNSGEIVLLQIWLILFKS
jgi:hypothetical protein